MNKAAIFGSTGTGKRVYDICKNEYDIEFFVDTNPERYGEYNDGLPIYPVDVLKTNRVDKVIIGVLTRIEDAIRYLKEIGYNDSHIVEKYVDLSYRARRASLESIKTLLMTKAGSVGELGVYRGDFAKVINELFPDRKLYLFDTFEGFPEEDIKYEIDNNLLTNKVGMLSNTSEELVLSKMNHPEQCVIRKGYFPDTSIGLEDEEFIFVNIDVDLYKPIKAGLDFFWPRMIRGGYIFVHDYFSNAYSGVKKAVEEFSRENKIGFSPIGDTYSISFVKGK